MINNNPIDEVEEYKIHHETRKFLREVSNWNKNQVDNVNTLLGSLRNQQEMEANLEGKRGLRYMWQRTPKLYLGLLAYFLAFGTAAAFAFSNFPNGSGFEALYLWIATAIILCPLLVVLYLGYHYVKQIKHKQSIEKEKLKLARSFEDLQKINDDEEQDGEREV